MVQFVINMKENFINKFKIFRLKKFLNRIEERTNSIKILDDVDFKVVIVDKEHMNLVSKDYVNPTPLGMFSKKDLIIYLRLTGDLYNLSDTYYHELGHLIDYIGGLRLGYDKSCTDSVNITDTMEEDLKFIDYFWASEPKEFFAQSFSEYIRGTHNSAMMFETKKMFKEILEVA